MRIDEILGFATSRPKKHTVKRRPPEKEEEPISLKIQKRRAAAAKGDNTAFTNKFNKANK